METQVKYSNSKEGEDIGFNQNYENKMQLQEMKERYLDNNIFYGLTNLNTGFDVDSIKYFSESDFRLVLQRVEKLGIGIMGIEPWLNGEFYDVKVFDEFNATSNDPKWYKQAFLEFTKRGEKLQYAASYEVPNEELNK